MGDRKSVALLARCAAVRARRAVHETCRLECSSVSSPLRKPEAESRVTPHGRSGPAPPELLGTSRLLRSNPAAQLPAPLIGTVSGSRGITRRLGITKGSALEIPQNTDDAWNQVLGFQGQSPWL